ncbi:Cystathionine gamma-synthase [Pyricularia oryzae]|nr:Folylpolyglutamate synthetase [Pyricularia oryzae]KAI6429876.1 Folylpolyglutamate synthetase [Pyricularia oryzae]KAI6551651.1 Folylpolyglutamate synthetase [Pyricularia oryzae]
MIEVELGASIPPDTAHAVSVSLPTWQANVGYEEGQSWVVDRMTTGYPRFFIHKTITGFADELAARFGQPGQKAMLFPNRQAALRCVDYVRGRAPSQSALAGLDAVHLTLTPEAPKVVVDQLRPISPAVSAVLLSPEAFPVAKEYWQHSGDGVSSRRAEFCQNLFSAKLLVPEGSSPLSPQPPVFKSAKGPRRYRRETPSNDTPAPNGTNGATTPPRAAKTQEQESEEETERFLEERFGRNLDISLLPRARSAIKRRIAGALSADHDISSSHTFPAMESNTRGVNNLVEDDVLIYPCGMNAIFHAHRLLMSARGRDLKSINFGFPYVDTLKILQKFGPGCVFYGHASEADLDDLERRLEAGERYLALFCEFPGNPLLTCPNLARIRTMADKHDFAVVVDETIGTFSNINVLQYADIVVSSLTKIFSGDCNVMGGSSILNPNGRYYGALKAAVATDYEDTYWAEDVLFMERNSRDFASRVVRINVNAEAVCDLLHSHPLVRRVHYPRVNADRANYEQCRLPSGGYGGLLSVVFRDKEAAVAFYDAIKTAKGPSLGTNFTLVSPYVLLAHYNELDWAASLGVDPNLLRISIGLGETEELVDTFKKALEVAEVAVGAAGKEEAPAAAPKVQ